MEGGAELLGFLETARKAMDRHPAPTGAIILTLDEAQNLNEAHVGGAVWMHLGGHGWPILPVLAGLADTPEALGRAGVSRLSSGRDRRLRRLSIEESRLAFPALCGKYGVHLDTSVTRAWSERIARDSLGFPQHLHVGLQAAAAELNRAGGRPAPESLRRAAKEAASRRVRYYRARLGPELHRHGAAMLAAVRCVRKSGGRAHADHVEAAFRRTSDADRKRIGRPPLPPGEAARLVNAAIHNGVFWMTSRGELELSIPSMGDYVEQEFGDREGGGFGH